MRHAACVVLVGMALWASACSSPPSAGAAGGGPAPSTARGRTALYHRLGGYDAVAAVVDDFLRRMITDSVLAGFFQDMSAPERNRVRQMLVDQLCEMSGGPCVYVGQDMRTAHQALGITEDDWNRAVTHLVATLDQFKVVGREREELLAAISSLKGEIVP